VLIAEVCLRVSGFTYFNPYVVDRDVGFSLRPYAKGWWRKEGLTYVKISSQGLRDREHTIAKPADTIRIAVLGDSFAEAFQVPVENAFWAVIESRLQECSPAGRKVEVLNFGVSGFSTARELIFLRQRVWQYSPDIVLLLVTTGNDVRDNSRVLNAYPNAALPYFVYQEGSLALDDSRLRDRNASIGFRMQQSFAGKSFDWIRDRLRVLGLIYSAREAYAARNEQNERFKRSAGEPGIDKEVLSAPVNSDWQEAWRVTEGLIVQMRDEVKAKGAKFLVVTGSNGIQVSPDAAKRAAYMNELGIDTLFYPDLRIESLGEREGFEVLTLAPPLLEYATRNQIFLHGPAGAKGTGHWNVTGHRLAGEIIAEKLCQPVWCGRKDSNSQGAF
jgi:hypothetical protein